MSAETNEDRILREAIEKIIEPLNNEIKILNRQVKELQKRVDKIEAIPNIKYCKNV